MIWPLYWIFNGCFPSFWLASLFSGKSRIVIRITNIVNKFGFPNFVQKFLINNFCPDYRFERSGKRRRMDFFNRCETICYGVLPRVGSVYRICLCSWPGFGECGSVGIRAAGSERDVEPYAGTDFSNFVSGIPDRVAAFLFFYVYFASAKCK